MHNAVLICGAAERKRELLPDPATVKKFVRKLLHDRERTLDCAATLLNLDEKTDWEMLEEYEVSTFQYGNIVKV